MLEKRLTTRLSNYWEMIRKGQVIPDFAALNRAQIEDIWPHCIVFQLQPGGAPDNPEFRIADMGPKLVELYCSNLTGQKVTKKNKQFTAANLIKRAGEVLESPQPLLDEGKFINQNSKVIKYRSCLVPFGNPATGEVTHLLAGISWREF